MQKVQSKYKILRDYVAGNKDWADSKLESVNLSNAVLKGIDLSDSQLEKVNLDSSNLEGSNLSNSIFINCNLSNTRLKKAVFAGANLQQTNLHNAHLEAANLRQANLKNADLTEAYLYCADLRGADLTGVQLQDAFLASAIYDEATVFDDDFFVIDTGMVYQPTSNAKQPPTSSKSIDPQPKRTFFYRGVCYEATKSEPLQITSAKAIKYRGVSYNG